MDGAGDEGELERKRLGCAWWAKAGKASKQARFGKGEVRLAR